MKKRWLFLMVELSVLVALALIFVVSIARYDIGILETQLENTGVEWVYNTEESLITYTAMLKALGYNFMEDDQVQNDKFYKLSKFYKDRYPNILFFEYLDLNNTVMATFPNLKRENAELEQLEKEGASSGAPNSIELRYMTQQRTVLRLDQPFFNPSDALKGSFACWIDIKGLFDGFTSSSKEYSISIYDGNDRLIYGEGRTQNDLGHTEKMIIGSQTWTVHVMLKENAILLVILKVSGLFIVMLAMIIAIMYSQWVIYKRDQSLEEVNEELGRSLKELQKSQQRLVETEKVAALGQLVATVAHEINTPLGNCIMTNSYLKQKSQEIKDEFMQGQCSKKELEEYFHSLDSGEAIIRSSLERMKLIVDRFKALAVKNLNHSLETFDLRNVAEEAFESHAYAKGYTWSISGEEHLIICGIRSAYEEIFNNLISNSIVHGFAQQQNQAPHIQIEMLKMIASPNDPPSLKITFSDNGSGVEKDLLTKIVEPLFSTNRTGGSGGIGLNVIMNLLSYTLSGTLSLESEKGKGFTVILHIGEIQWV